MGHLPMAIDSSHGTYTPQPLEFPEQEVEFAARATISANASEIELFVSAGTRGYGLSPLAERGASAPPDHELRGRTAGIGIAAGSCGPFALQE
jgi:hypothetical protein